MSNTPNLLPCAFCGGMATAKPIDSVPGWYHVTVLHSDCFYKPAQDKMLLNDEHLAAWNRRTLPPANLGFTIENRAGADVLVWQEGGCRSATSAEIAMWNALSAVQQPVVREPLTDDQLWANDEIMSLNADLGWHMDTIRMFTRAIERAHGIAQKGGR